MLNDVRPPPIEPRDDGKDPRKVAKSNGRQPLDGRSSSNNGTPLDRAHQLDRETGRHSSGIDLVYRTDPEDRGDSFNTMMSAVIVGTVLTVAAIVAWVVLF